MLNRALFLLVANPVASSHVIPGAPNYSFGFKVAQAQGPSLPKPHQGLRVGSQVPLRLAAK
jgi:hypothetical protein